VRLHPARGELHRLLGHHEERPVGALREEQLTRRLVERPPAQVSATRTTTRIRTEGRVVDLEVEGVHEVVTASW